MNQYTNFAYVYDAFMDNIPYDDWCRYVVSLLRVRGITGGILAELGCGTGNLTVRLADYGYKVIGIDNSVDMLNVAAEKLIPSYRRRIRYTLQDMRDFSIKKPVQAMVSICDSMNYILSPKELSDVFCCVSQNLAPGGFFIFDMKTPYFYEEIVGSRTIADNYENSSFIWENHYNSKRRQNYYRLSVFVREHGSQYRRFNETHCQRAYTIEEVKAALCGTGLALAQVYDAFTTDLPHSESERIYFIIRKED